jgi:hypothetical protein
LLVSVALVHLEEAAIQGASFYAAGLVAAIVAAILAWPSRLAYLSGAAHSLTLVAFWAVFVLVLLPGSETASTVGLVGLVTKGSGVGGGNSLHHRVASSSPCLPARPDRARRFIAPPRVR